MQWRIQWLTESLLSTTNVAFLQFPRLLIFLHSTLELMQLILLSGTGTIFSKFRAENQLECLIQMEKHPLMIRVCSCIAIYQWRRAFAHHNASSVEYFRKAWCHQRISCSRIDSSLKMTMRQRQWHVTASIPSPTGSVRTLDWPAQSPRDVLPP